MMISTHKQPSLWLAPGVYQSDFTESILVTSFCKIIGIHLQDLRIKSRLTEVRLPRQILVTLIKLNFPDMSLKKIGFQFNLNHATVIHSMHVIDNLKKTDKIFNAYYNDIADQITKQNLLHNPLLR